MIGNRWVEKTRLKILNGYLLVGGIWAPYNAVLQTNLSERGFLIGFSHMGGWSVNTMIRTQILFDGQPAHQGFFRIAMDMINVEIGNQQPTRMSTPQLDIPENTEVSVRAQLDFGLAVDSWIDLAAVVYYIKDWEAAPPVCFPTDVVPPDPV